MSKALSIYLMAGADTPALAEAAVAGGADLLELGFPFSDPLADGPVIRRAGERALAAGMRTQRCLDVLRETRERLGPDVPLIPMTYASLLEAYGWERFAADARAAGATSVIVADLPAGERPELKRVQLVAPTSTDERIGRAARETEGWLYLVTVTGHHRRPRRRLPALAGLVERARAAAPDVPLYAGFGISTPQQARAAADLADGIVVGTRAVEVADEGPAALHDVRPQPARRVGRISLLVGCGKRPAQPLFFRAPALKELFCRSILPISASSRRPPGCSASGGSSGAWSRSGSRARSRRPPFRSRSRS